MTHLELELGKAHERAETKVEALKVTFKLSDTQQGQLINEHSLGTFRGIWRLSFRALAPCRYVLLC
jgi:hypothetical protein